MADEPQHISAQDARGGEIILRSKRRRLIFVVALVVAVLVAVLLRSQMYR